MAKGGLQSDLHLYEQICMINEALRSNVSTFVSLQTKWDKYNSLLFTCLAFIQNFSFHTLYLW